MPSVAAIFNFDIPQTNVILAEEENHSSTPTVVFEKIIPRVISIHDFLTFSDGQSRMHSIMGYHERIHRSPHLSIFSPPPEA